MEWTGYLGTGTALVGVAIGGARWRQLGRGQRFIVFWLGTSALIDLTTYVAAPILRDTQQIGRVWFLASVVLAVEALAAYQQSGVRTSIFRLVWAGYAVTWVAFALTIEPIRRLSTFSGPLQGIVLLGASVATLFRRVSIGRRDFLADAGFLIAAALAAVAIPAAFQTVAAQVWLNGNVKMVYTYYSMNNIVSVLAAGVMIVAIRLPASDRTA